MQPNLGVMGGVKKFVDLIVDDDNNESEKNCFSEYISQSNTEHISPPTPVTAEHNQSESDEPSSTSTNQSIEATNQEQRLRSKTAIAIRESVLANQEKAVENFLKKHDHKRNKKRLVIMFLLRRIKSTKGVKS